MQKAFLILSDGTVFEGIRIGADCDSIGELVFTTGMCSYLETLTDPGYDGQIVIQTFPMIGNYGVIEADFEGDCALHGYVVRECCTSPSNFRSQYHLEQFLLDNNIPGICNVDTRALTTIIREKGIMNAMICSKIPADLNPIQTYQVVPHFSSKEPETLSSDGEPLYRVALWDFGTRKSIISALRSRGIELTILPVDTTAEQVLAIHPDGLIISNGPGNPTSYHSAITEISKLISKIPIFGYGLGHQLIALAQGGQTTKLLYGHHGDNQPVRDLVLGRTYITTQNHGYCVLFDSLPGVAIERYQNANDYTCEGLDYPGKKCFSVQFHPDGDVGFILDRFINMMGGNN